MLKKNKSNFNSLLCLESLTGIVFCFLFLSIPLCSFDKKTTYITWILTAIFLFLVCIHFIFFKAIKIDIVNISLICFCISAIISTLLNDIRSFAFTPIFMCLLVAIIYTYVKSDIKIKRIFILSIFTAILIFGLIFFIKYKTELLSFNFKRLGGIFGDQNDISLFFGLGCIISIYLLFFDKKIFIKIIALFLTLFLLFLGMSTGSKIFILLFIGTLFSTIILAFGKKKKWLCFVSISLAICSVFILLLLPPFVEMKNRLLDALYFVLFKSSYTGHIDYSTANRLIMFKNGINMFLRKPLFGYGIEGFKTFGGYNNGWSHNNLSESLCNFGLIGTILFHAGFLYSFFNIIRKNKDKDFNLDLLVFIYFILVMISIPLCKEKIYAYSSGVFFSTMCDTESNLSIDFTKWIKNHKKVITLD